MARHTVIPAVHLFLLHGDQILLSRRFHTGYEDGNYSVPAGHVELGETATEAMLREATEEVGIFCDPKRTKCVHTMYRKRAGEDGERVDFFFECTKWSGEVSNAEPEKCDDLRWFPLASLPDNTIGYVRFAIQNYMETTFFSEYGWHDESSFSSRLYTPQR